MPNVKLVFNPINVTNTVFIVVTPVSAPLQEVARLKFNPPHAQRNITVPDLQPIMYTVTTWESADGVTLGTRLGACDLDASLFGDGGLLEVYEHVVDRGSENDPAADSTQYRNPKLAGAIPAGTGEVPEAGCYQVFHRGVGPKLASEITNAAEGGFDLNGGELFNEADVWIVNLYKKLAAAPGAAVKAGSFVTDCVDLTEEVTVIDASHYNKRLSFVSTTLAAEAQLDLETIPDMTVLVFDTHDGLQNYGLVQLEANQFLQYNRSQLNRFYMAPSEELALLVKGGRARVLWYHGNAATRGRIIGDYRERPGYRVAKGETLYQFDFPGLYEWVDSLPAGYAVSFDTWGQQLTVGGLPTGIYPYKGRWAIDRAQKAIRTPLATGAFVRFLKDGADDSRVGGNVPGAWQSQGLQDHQHKVERGTTKRGGGSDPSGHAVKSPYGDALGQNFFDQSGWIDGGSVGETRPWSQGLLPLVTL